MCKGERVKKKKKQERKRKRKKKKEEEEEDEGKGERECGSVIKYNFVFFFYSLFATVHSYRWLCTVTRS